MSRGPSQPPPLLPPQPPRRPPPRTPTPGVQTRQSRLFGTILITGAMLLVIGALVGATVFVYATRDSNTKLKQSLTHKPPDDQSSSPAPKPASTTPPEQTTTKTPPKSSPDAPKKVSPKQSTTAGTPPSTPPQSGPSAAASKNTKQSETPPTRSSTSSAKASPRSSDAAESQKSASQRRKSIPPSQQQTGATNASQGASQSSPPLSTPQTKSTAAAPASPSAASQSSPLPPDPFYDLAQRNWVLAISPHGKAGSEKPQEIAKVYVAPASKCDLSLLGGDVVLGGGRRFDLECKDIANGTRSWTVIATSANPLGKDQELGRFSLQNQSLQYVWNPDATASVAAMLRLCLLQFQVDDAKEHCFLCAPQETTTPIAIDVDKSTSHVEPKWDVPALLDPAIVRLDIQVDTPLTTTFNPNAALKPGERGTLHFTLPSSTHNNHASKDIIGSRSKTSPSYSAATSYVAAALDVEIEFEMEPTCQLSLKLLGRPIEGKTGDNNSGRSVPICRRWLEIQRKKLASTGGKKTPPQSPPVYPSKPTSKQSMSRHMAADASQQRSSRSQPTLAAKERWYADMTKLMDELENAKLLLRFYIEIDGNEVDLYRTAPSTGSEQAS